MRVADLPEVRALPLFAEMAEDQFEYLARAAYLQTFPPNVDLTTEGEPADFLHILIAGTVELLASWTNRETTIAVLQPVSTFILAATVRDAPYLMSARTVSKSRIVLMASEDIRTVFSNDAAFARAIVTELASGYRSVVKAAKALKLRTGTERLANYLLWRHETEGSPGTFELRLEKRRLASLLGMTPENLSRAIKALGPYGVSVDGAAVSLGDKAALVAFAKPSPLIDDPDH